MNVLVTGANGQLGNEMRIVSEMSKDNYIFTDVAELDITDTAAVRNFICDNDIKIVVNCAAYTNVDKAEDDREFAELLNATAVGNIAAVMADNGGWLFHVSTDYVFGGTRNNTPCRENEPANPTGVYGVTKLHGEEAVISSGCKYVIIRTAWLYSEFGKNFLKTMLAFTATKPQLKVVFDQVGTPTYAYDLASAIFDIIENRKFEGKAGIYHYSNEGVCSWFDFACEIARMSGASCEVLPCRSEEYPSDVKRPAYSVLDKTKFKRTFQQKISYWRDSLRICLDRLGVLKK